MDNYIDFPDTIESWLLICIEHLKKIKDSWQYNNNYQDAIDDLWKLYCLLLQQKIDNKEKIWSIIVEIASDTWASASELQELSDLV